MSQAAETPMQLTTSTDVNVAINQALKSGNLAETLRFLLAVGTSPERLKQAFGSISHDASILCAVEIADGKKFLNEYERLDPEQRAEMDAETRAWIAAGKFKARHKDEEPAEGNEHAAKLGSALAGAHTFEEKVHAFDQHFAGGGAIWETAEAMGLSREQAEKVKGREKELSEEWDRKHQGEREKVSAELQRRGKSKEEADRMAKEREDAQRTRDNFLRMEREGMFNGADPERLAANRKAVEDRANRSDFGMTQSLVKAPAPWAVKAEVEELSKAAASGALTHAQELAMKAAEAAHTKGGLDKLKDDKELEKFAIKATIKADGSALGKELGAAAAAAGAISEKRIVDAKVEEKAGRRDGKGITASEDEFASLGESAPAVASVDIKGKLASMRNAETPAPASKGPALA